jgi:HprK-related kinase B
VSDSPETLSDVRARLLADAEPAAPHVLDLAISGFAIRVRSNTPALVAELAEYFRGNPSTGADPELVVHALETPDRDAGVPLVDWPREPGKSGRKEALCDLADGRLVRKVRTGMQFLIGRGAERWAIGPCRANPNQVVNFVIAQYIAWRLDRDAVLCHAAAVCGGGRGLAVAGLSGGGKSTLALRLVARGLDFVSNDRLLVRRADGAPRAYGVPKLPRINPGTALHQAELEGVLPPERRAALRALPREELWDLEEKYDVDVERRFPGASFEDDTPLHALVVLDWERDGSEPTRLERVELSGRPDLLAAVAKSAGPFFLPRSGPAPKGPTLPPDAAYHERLRGVEVAVLRGRVDFDAAAEHGLELLGLDAGALARGRA